MKWEKEKAQTGGGFTPSLTHPQQDIPWAGFNCGFLKIQEM